MSFSTCLHLGSESKAQDPGSGEFSRVNWGVKQSLAGICRIYLKRSFQALEGGESDGGNELPGSDSFTGIWEREKGFEVGSVSEGEQNNVKHVLGKS